MRVTMLRIIVAVALATAGAPTLADVATPGRADAVHTASTVSIDNFTFNPQRLTVKIGTTVTWTNKDDIPHAIASVTKQFKSKTLDTDDQYAFTFTMPGTYEYFCSLHPHMTGTIVVEATASGGDPAD